MKSVLTTIFSRAIEYSFYAIFFFVPLAFTSQNYELFEFNKMWVTFGFTIIITASWIAKMVLERKILIQKTPLDIPLLLFLLSQTIATFHTLDFHTSLWGFYSRFNGGYLSILSYILLYFAFVSNQKPDGKRFAKRVLVAIMASGIVVALWGLPSHFGYDPTCLIFRGTLDVSCWTDAFQPRLRIFSTIGQPNWLAAYLAVLLPLALAYTLKAKRDKQQATSIFSFRFAYHLFLIALFYVDILFTNSRSGFLGLLVALFIFIFLLIIKRSDFILKNKLLFVIIAAIFFALSANGTPLSSSIEKLLHPAIKQDISVTTSGSVLETGGTESSEIRKIVWRGAIDIWKHHKLFGTGVESFASSYYLYRPSDHNLTSEWDYLYNKAHNEYLNYLATTGAFGLGSYLLLIGWFIYLTIKHLLFNIYDLRNQKNGKSSIINDKSYILILALFSGYVSILISNFFGFSVVIINIFFFMIPAIAITLTGMIPPRETVTSQFQSQTKSKTPVDIDSVSIIQLAAVFFLLLTSYFLLLTLFRYWQADTLYALGYNLDHASEYQSGHPLLEKAVELRNNEPMFQDELSINNAILATAFAYQKDATMAAKLAKIAISESNDVVNSHPNNLIFWKTRVRVFYALSQIDPTYMPMTLNAIQKANKLAPTDAKISYNLGVLYGQNGYLEKAVETLNETIKLKPDYKEAYYALGLFYHEKAVDKKDKVVNPKLQEKAVAQMQFILNHFATNDAEATKSLKDWGEIK